jgi:glycerol uptake operon antiterminator
MSGATGIHAKNTSSVGSSNTSSYGQPQSCITELTKRHSLHSLLAETPIIPAVRSPEFLTQAVSAQGRIVYLLCGDPENIEEMAAMVNEKGKTAIVNLDLISGFQRDAAAVTYLAHRGLHGIISTHPEPLRAARKMNMFAIERTFLLDSAALQSALRSIEQFRQDAVEVLPAIVAPHLIRKVRCSHPDLPIIAGGLITTFREIEDLIAWGVSSVSVSDRALWLCRAA